MKKKRKLTIRKIFLKNSIGVLIPLIIYFIIMFGILQLFPITYKIMCYNVETIGDIERCEEKGNTKLELSHGELTYTGYDYYENDKLVGAYYIGEINEDGVFFLVKTNNPIPTIESGVIRCKILSNSSSYDGLVGQIEKDYGSVNLENNFYKSILSEVDYPYIETALAFAVIYFPMASAVFLTVMCIIWLRIPESHPLSRQLLHFGTDKRGVIEELDSQMNYGLLLKTKHFIVTKEYLIVTTWYNTEIVKADFVKYISKHIIVKRNTKEKRKNRCVITLSNPEKMYFEHIFKDEREVDEMLDILEKQCTNMVRNE